jgi:hypothetical protein
MDGRVHADIDLEYGCEGGGGRRIYKGKPLPFFSLLPTTPGWIVGGSNGVYTLFFPDRIIGLLKSVEGIWRLKGSLHDVMWELLDLQAMKINQAGNTRLWFSKLYISGLETLCHTYK